MVRANTPLSIGPFPRPSDELAAESHTALPGASNHAPRVALDHLQSLAALEDWREFVEQYEQLTDLLCVAAKEGACSRREARYAALRSWLLEYYPHVGPWLRPFFPCCLDRSEIDVTWVDPLSGQRRVLDCFESVLVPSTLKDLFRQDCGGLIERVSRVSEAVYQCDDLVAGIRVS
jgi:hypothetical protein